MGGTFNRDVSGAPRPSRATHTVAVRLAGVGDLEDAIAGKRAPTGLGGFDIFATPETVGARLPANGRNIQSRCVWAPRPSRATLALPASAILRPPSRASALLQNWGGFEIFATPETVGARLPANGRNIQPRCVGAPRPSRATLTVAARLAGVGDLAAAIAGKRAPTGRYSL